MSRAEVTLALVLIWAGCGGGASAPDSEAPSRQTPFADAAVAWVDGAGTAGPRLGIEHPGWKKAKCLDCHDRVALPEHHQGTVRTPPSCVGCHGYNGAPHVDHAADPTGQCGECHGAGAVAADHLSDYLLPQDCATCHVHPSNRGGL